MSAIIDAFKTDVNARIDKLKTDLFPPVTPPAPTPTPTPSNIYDQFAYNWDFGVNGKDTPNGLWHNEYLSQGYARVTSSGPTMTLRPGGTELNIYGGSVLVRSTKKWGNFRATFDVMTEEQVYTKNSSGQTIVPPGWQSSWLLFRHLDKWRHWYIIVGLKQLEIGKKDAPTSITDQKQIEQYQYTLWTGNNTNPTPLKQKRRVTVEFIGNVLKVFYDGALQATLKDDGHLKNQRGQEVTQSAWTSGEICPYVEGAKGFYYPFTVETL